MHRVPPSTSASPACTVRAGSIVSLAHMQTTAPDLATRHAYDAVARDYARLLPDMSPEAPLDRAVLSAFVEMLSDDSRAFVAEVGCGTGRVSKHLSDLGVRVFGLDLSPAMVAIAQDSHSHLPFAAGHAAALPLRAGVLHGLVAWYSIINLPTSALSSVFKEFARVTATGTPVLVAFQSGDGQRIDRATSYGQAGTTHLLPPPDKRGGVGSGDCWIRDVRRSQPRRCCVLRINAAGGSLGAPQRAALAGTGQRRPCAATGRRASRRSAVLLLPRSLSAISVEPGVGLRVAPHLLHARHDSRLAPEHPG